MVWLVLAVVIIAVTATVVSARADDWPKSSEWDRKYPTEGPNGASIYKLTSVRAALVNLVGEQFYRHVILAWNEYLPIIATSDTIFVEGCQPGACQIGAVTTVFQGRKISVCLYREFLPKNSDGVAWPSERIWFIDGVGLPVVERDPDNVDNDQCSFESMDDLNTKLQHARALAEQN